jgi:hemerythrin
LGKELIILHIEWTPYLALGVSVIDNQHMELFGRFNSLVDALMQDQGEKELAGVIDFLQDYVVTHFAAEEEIMDRYSYATVSAHKSQHEAFVEDFASFRKQLESSAANRTLAVDVLKRLGEWLVNHVQRTDQHLGAFLRVAMAVRRAA